MNQQESSISVSEVSLVDILFKTLEKWYVVVISILVCVISTFVYVQFFCTPMYSSTAKIFIFDTKSAATNSGELTISTYLARDYAELITDRAVLDVVIDNLKLNQKYTSLKSDVSINNPDGTRILEITVKSYDAKLSKKIADEVCVVSQQKIVDLMGIDRVNIISKGQVPRTPSSPNKQKYLLFSFFAGVVVSMIIVFLIFVSSDKIEFEEDIQKYLDMNVLATIPYANSAKRRTNSSVKGKRK